MRLAYPLTFFANMSIALSSMIIPLLAEDLDISYFYLGLVVMAYGIASSLSYFLFGRLSDSFGKRVVFVRVGFAAGFLTFLFQVLMHDWGSMMVVRSLAGFSVGISSFPLLAYLSEFSGYEGRVWVYSGFGSLGWFVGYMGAGVIPSYDPVFILAALMFLLGFLLSLRMHEVRGARRKLSPSWDIVKKNYAVYFSYLLRHTGAYCVWTIFPLYLIELGATRFWVGVIYSLNCVLQFFVMSSLGRLGRKLDERFLIRVGLLLSSLVFLGYSLATSYLQIVPIQVMLAFAWSTLYVGSLLYLLARNVEKATSTGILGSTISLAGVVGPFVGGTISELFGLRAVMYVAFVLTALATILSGKA